MGDVSYAPCIPAALRLGLAWPNGSFRARLPPAADGDPSVVERDVLLGATGRLSGRFDVLSCHLSTSSFGVGTHVRDLYDCLPGAPIHFPSRTRIFWSVALLGVPGYPGDSTIDHGVPLLPRTGSQRRDRRQRSLGPRNGRQGRMSS